MLGLGLGLNKSYGRKEGISTQQICEYSFNGTNQYLNFGDILDGVISGANPEFTIQMWIKRNTLGTTQILLGKYDFGGLLGFKLAFNSSNLLQWIQSSTGSDTQGSNSDNAYTNNTDRIHIVFTLDYTQASYSLAPKMYMNGVLIDSTPTTSTKNPIYNTSAPLVIGVQNTPAPNNFFDGEHIQTSIQSRVLTPTEILDDYNFGNPKAPTGNVEFYINHKEDTFSTNWTIKDLSTNANDGVSVNMIEGDRTCVQSEVLKNVISPFKNSIVYSIESDYSKRSTGAEFEFNYSGTSLWLRSEVSGNNSLIMLIDDVYDSTITLTDDTLFQLTLGAGQKKITLIEPSVGTSLLLGSWLKHIIVEKSKFSKINEGFINDRYVFLGDSITQGSGATNPVLGGYAHLFKYNGSKIKTTLGFGGALIRDMVDATGSSLTTTLSWINSAFENTNGEKKLTILLGTNDWADGYSPSAINTRYITLVDAINAEDPTIKMYIISPTHRVGEDANMTTIRSNIATMCSTRTSFITFIDGTNILNAGDLADTVHPTDAGHLKLYNAVAPTILA